MQRLIESAETAAEESLQQMYSCIRNRRHFKLEAGAGAGKTFSLVKGLQFIIDEQGIDLAKRFQRVACITYTNVATEEINTRTDSNPVVFASTIHGFCWSLIQNYQPFLWESLPTIDSKWEEMINEIEEKGKRKILYSTGRRRLTDTEAYLSHDDILPLMVLLLSKEKFRLNLVSKYPIIFIDEYQDTHKEFAEALVEYFVSPEVVTSTPLLGFFGDSWQKIYRIGVGSLTHPNLTEIRKHANFRSDSKIVETLNNMRPELPQVARNDADLGSVCIYHTNNWIGDRQNSGHWKGDLFPNDSHDALVLAKSRLTGVGWDFSSETSRILMLTHKVMASEQGYETLVNAFSNNDSLFNLENNHISYLVNTLLPALDSFEKGLYGKMFLALGSSAPKIKKAMDKVVWKDNFDALSELKEDGSVGDVLSFLKTMSPSILPDKISSLEDKLDSSGSDEISQSRSLNELQKLRDVPFKELIAFEKYINNHTPFSTKHGVKGAEFDNVLVVLGRGWNLYNWDQLFMWLHTTCPENKRDALERNRNLFYVACSRPKHHLAVLITQHLSDESLALLNQWFGHETVRSLY
ncbi:TPA: ATP-dependent helicase [Enterobacter soli]|uniref:DNA 3'-5' helicase II n=1 Tax=Enterobacter soli TaxID=885040 RepID=A0AAW8H521_9ENTR|nr:UvrD-helicase domain-containing protein [Enterobacter soli]MDQ2254609.1 UvrD-helicase domain-containing protein [Enterobacter soli]MDQ2337943.1 UvrD-helicase domain-containing protein [Enterobacter soli]HEE9787981.1 ATP-dependent helicase [Enterobacter soli]